MTDSRSDLRGIAFMVMSMGSFIATDTLLKLAVADIPVFESLALRGATAAIAAVMILVATGQGRAIRQIVARPVLLRDVFEVIGALGYIVALATAPLADISALTQLSPIFLLLGGYLLFRDRVRPIQAWLILLSMIGAVLVAQPGGAGFTPFALLGLWNALCIAGRDLSGRMVKGHVPGMVVALSAALATLVVAGGLSLALENWVWPTGWELLLFAGSGVMLNFGQMFVLLAYRSGRASVVVPFTYTSTLWALLSGALIFGTVPNALALFGIALIAISGALVLALKARSA